MIVYLNGKLVTESKASISIHDHGFLYGDGVYETLRVYDGKPFLLSEHLKRLNDSLRGISLAPPMALVQIGRAIQQTIDANRHKEAAVRLTITRGPGSHGFDPRVCEKPTVLITSRPFNGWPPAVKKKGWTLAVVSVRRNDPRALPPSIKSISCLNNIRAKIEATEMKADDALMLTRDNQLSEATASNIFVVMAGKLFTPALDGHQLAGVTREYVCRLAAQSDIPVVEKILAVSDLARADEVFLTSSLIEIMPVNRVVGPAPAGTLKRLAVGPVTRRLAQLYRPQHS